RLAVRRALASVCGTIQPAVLARSFDGEAFEAGVAARFLLAMPPRCRRGWTEVELPDNTVERYSTLLQALLALPLADVEKRRPHVLGISGPAKAIWVQFCNEWGVVQRDAEGEQAAAFATIEAYAARLALLHHVVAHVVAGVDDARPVAEKSMQAGIDLARWFADEAVRIYATLRESEEERQTRRLVELVRSHGGRTTVKQLQRSNSRKWSSSDLAKAALQGLVDIGLARWEEALSGPKGGRPTKICSLIPLPTIDDTDETVSSQTAPYQEPAAPPPDETSPSSDETPTGAEKIQDYSGLVGIGDSRTPIARG